MRLALRLLVEFLGLKIIDGAISAIVTHVIENYVKGDDSPGGDPSAPDYQIPTDIRHRLFSKDSIYKIFIDAIVIAINAHLKDPTLSKRDILYSVGLKYKWFYLNELLFDHLTNHQIIVTEVPNAQATVSFSDFSIDQLSNLSLHIFQVYLQNNVGDIHKQSSITGIPHRILAYLDECYRALSLGIVNRYISIPPTDDHVIYDQRTSQKDIFGNELIFGRLAIIKYKDSVSDVYTYGLVMPNAANFDYTISFDWVLKDENINSFAEKVGICLNSSDLILKELPYPLLERYIRKIY